GGVLLYRWMVTFIPDRLRAYPIPAMLWSAVGIGTLTAAPYTGGNSLRTALVAPWLLAQIPAAFMAAGVYGILNGWLAVDGSADWWPLAPPPPPVDLQIPLGPDDITRPGVFDRLDLDQPAPIPQTPRGHRPRTGGLITAALVLGGIGIAWSITTVITRTVHVLSTELDTGYTTSTSN
ncbi:MAG: hypothetical protein JO280_09700, partial [Mycobacteriaceae bacterium]|nr:hypothetical protein [Mycobacteriaceae bacterium]